MSLELITTEDRDTGDFHIRLVLPDGIKRHLHASDLPFYHDCVRGSGSVADKLLGIELLVRRYEEASQPTNKEGQA